MPREILGPPEAERSSFSEFRVNSLKYLGESAKLIEERRQVLTSMETEENQEKLRTLVRQWQTLTKAIEESDSKAEDWLETSEFFTKEEQRVGAAN